MTTLEQLFADTQTRAFIVIKDDQIVYEVYQTDGSRDALNPAFGLPAGGYPEGQRSLPHHVSLGVNLSAT